jgi:hypothetical protein
MPQDTPVRWTPIDGLPELALGGLDLAYTASENRLTIRAYFRTLSELGFPQFEHSADGVIIEFENVEAFKAYEEFTDPVHAEKLEVPLLAESVPYGGTWGFIEMLNSSWLERLAERNGSWEAASASHWIVLTGDMVVHVATEPSVPPIFKGWIARRG